MMTIKDMTTVTDEQIEDFIVNLMNKDPVKFIQYAMCVIAKEIYRTNATTFEFSQELDLEEGKRFKIILEGKIEKL